MLSLHFLAMMSIVMRFPFPFYIHWNAFVLTRTGSKTTFSFGGQSTGAAHLDDIFFTACFSLSSTFQAGKRNWKIFEARLSCSNKNKTGDDDGDVTPDTHTHTHEGKSRIP